MKNKKKILREFNVKVKFNLKEDCFIARCTNYKPFKSLSGFGDTRTEAVTELETCMSAALDMLYKERGEGAPILDKFNIDTLGE